MKKYSQILPKLLLGIIFGFLIMSALVIYADAEKIYNATVDIDMFWLTKAMFFSIFIYIIRFFKWYFFLRRLHIKVPIVEAGGIYLSGISMGVTPGKSGEILKSYLLEKKLNIPFMISAPTLLSERLTGIMGCFALCVIALLLAGNWSIYVLYIGMAVLLILLLLVLIFCHDGLRNWTVNWLCKWELLARHKCQIENFYNSSFRLMGTRVVCMGTLFSMSYWMMEVMVFYSLLEGMNAMLELPQVMLLLTSVSIGGGLTMLPGSIGALEGGLMGMLAYMGTDRAVAGGAVLLHRILCMWFSVMIGAMVLCARYRKFLY